MESDKQSKEDLTKTQIILSDNSSNLTLKQKAGDAANRWLDRNKSLVLRQTPFWAQGFASILICLGGTALLVGIFFKIDEVVTVQGQLKSIGGTVEVKTPVGGKVAEVFFKDGDVVEKGDKLLVLDTQEATEQKALLTRLIGIEKEQLKTKKNTIASQNIMLTSRKIVLERRIETKEIIINEMSSLVQQGGFQRLQFLEQKDELFNLKNQLSELLEQQSQIQLQSRDITLQSEKMIDQMMTQLKSSELQLQYQNVIAPVSGIVFDPQASSQGVINPGERILSIVPQQGLYAEVYVPNKDIGFIKIDQEAKVRVDAFPFTRYGELSGNVRQISADALEPSGSQNFYRFPVKLKLSQSFLVSNKIKVPLKAGMSVTTNLKLRDKRVISLLSDLLVDQTDSIKSIRQQ